MRLNRSEKNKFIITMVIILIMLILLACVITFFLNINDNKGIIPIVFLLLAIYNIIMFSYNILYAPISNEIGKKTNNIKTRYLVFFIINLVFYALSYIVLW